VHKLHSLPTNHATDIHLDVLILSEKHQRVAARCQEQITVYDYKEGRKVPVTGRMKKAFEQMHREQEEQRGGVKGMIREIEEAVAKLEKGSWRKEGAVEDFGGV
jgi:hypothetical protein